ncbi:MAG: hypothetical protein AAFV88_03315 [Planctomycetota bacterium]
MAKYDDLDTRQIFIIGIGSVVVTVVTILAVQYVYYLLVDGYQDQLQAESRYTRQNRILAEQSADIQQYGADPLTANVTIPIEKAMDLVIEEQAKPTKSENDAT